MKHDFCFHVYGNDHEEFFGVSNGTYFAIHAMKSVDSANGMAYLGTVNRRR